MSLLWNRTIFTTFYQNIYECINSRNSNGHDKAIVRDTIINIILSTSTCYHASLFHDNACNTIMFITYQITAFLTGNHHIKKQDINYSCLETMSFLPPKLHNSKALVTYLQNRFDIDAIVDDDDRHLVHECNNDDLLSHHSIPNIEQCIMTELWQCIRFSPYWIMFPFCYDWHNAPVTRTWQWWS
jgi:hypothetical protein